MKRSGGRNQTTPFLLLILHGSDRARFRENHSSRFFLALLGRVRDAGTGEERERRWRRASEGEREREIQINSSPLSRFCSLLRKRPRGWVGIDRNRGDRPVGVTTEARISVISWHRRLSCVDETGETISGDEEDDRDQDRLGLLRLRFLVLPLGWFYRGTGIMAGEERAEPQLVRILECSSSRSRRAGQTTEAGPLAGIKGTSPTVRGTNTGKTLSISLCPANWVELGKLLMLD